MTPGQRRPLRRFLGFFCLLTLVTLALAVLGWPPTRRLAGEGSLRAMLAGIAVSFAASIGGGLPILVAERRRGSAAIRDSLASLAARLLLVLAGALYVLLLGAVAKAPFLIWVAISYLLLLPIDVGYVVRGGPAGGSHADER